MRKTLLASTLSLILVGCISADGPATETVQATTISETAMGYRADIESVSSVIKENHPRPFRFISEDDFDALVASEKASIDDASELSDVYWSMSRIIASIGCGHSKPFYFNAEDSLISIEQRFPLDVREFEGKLYVIDPLINGDQIETGAEITSINGISTEQILREVFAHISADNNFDHPKGAAFNVYATSYITYALDFPSSYQVEVHGASGPVELEGLTEFQFKPIRSPNDLCQQNLCYRTDEDLNLGIMTIHSFDYYGNRGQEFVDFVETVFSDLSDHENRSLLIDVRDNSGGSGLAANWILRRIAEQPYAYWDKATDPEAQQELFELQEPVETGFTGETYILMNENTFSVVPHFLALAKENGMATLIGTQAGGTISTNDGKRPHTTENTKYEYLMSTMMFEVDAPSMDPGTPIQPDVEIRPVLNDVLFGEDSVLDKALEYIAEQ